MLWNIQAKCQKPNLVRLGEQMCPRTCAACCKSRKFNFSVGQCDSFTQAMCRIPSLNKIALEICPHTCGLCDLPGADTIDGCESLRGFCHFDSIRNICQRTCLSRACFQNFTG
ncbi:unnamed protein product [Dracunculus medinensis]|uniref:ShKT domain-containing protein n=1 Tax=Dracunculus medinensis TaxID=318479 RepID=A0A0N4URU3_DRAME|nr:unnamed protein product [Dracunculus medinensis]